MIFVLIELISLWLFSLKKTLSILLIFVLIYNLIGYYTVFKVLQYQVRDEVKQRIKHAVPDDELVLISISTVDDKSLVWTKPQKEFRYNGEMYDVVKLKIKEDSIVYYCIHDFKESKLFSELGDYVKRYVADNPNQRRKAEILLERLIKDYFIQVFTINISYKEFINLRYRKYLRAYPSVCLKVLTPPPKLV
jgi:hypothetical protein